MPRGPVHTAATFASYLPRHSTNTETTMGRLFLLGVLALGAVLVLNDGKIPQVKSSGSGGAVSGYTGASSSAIKGIAAAAGG